MTPVFPWNSYDPDDIPDLSPHSKEDAFGCIATIITLILSTSLFVFIECMMLKLYYADWIDINGLAVMQIFDVVIYAALTMFLMKLSFKIVDKIIKKNNHHA